MAHPDGQHIIYPLGCTLIVKNLSTQEQTFLQGHTDNVSCLTCSQSGEYLASGQVTYMGFKADVIVWQFSDRSLYCRLTLHKVKVQALAFSPNDMFLATLGGQDDNRLVTLCFMYIQPVLPLSLPVSIVVWDLAKKEAVCGSQAAMQSTGPVYTLSFSRTRDDILVSGGE